MKLDPELCQKLLKQRSNELGAAYRELYRETAKRWQLEKELKDFQDRFDEKVRIQNNELEEALTKYKNFSGFMTICSSCKKILNDEGSWHRIEKFIEDQTGAKFTHSICPDCSRKLYPEIHEDR